MIGSSLLGLDVWTYNVVSVSSPIWNRPITIVREETVNLEKALADVTDRRANGWRLQRPTLIEASIDMQVTYDTNDARFAELRDAFFADTLLALAFMEGDLTTPGVWQGFLGAFRVTSFSMPRALEDAVVADLTLIPDLWRENSQNTYSPEWVSYTIT